MGLFQALLVTVVCVSCAQAQPSCDSGCETNLVATGTSKPTAKTNQGNGSLKPKKAKQRATFKWVNPLPQLRVAGLEHGTFASPSMGCDVGYLILLPRGYKQTKKRYPVVYYLHGGRPGSETKSYRLADSIRKLMNDAGLPPAIYVFVNGGPVSHYDMPDDENAQGASVFVKELIPHIDSAYRTIADRTGRALEGFSQGGRGTMRLSPRYPDVFCSAAAGGGGYETERRISESGGFESPKLRFKKGDNTWDLARDYVKQRKQPKVSWMIYVGTKGFNYGNNLEYMKFLTDIGIEFEQLVVPGVPHSASGIYAKAGEQIMRFHANNFKNSNVK